MKALICVGGLPYGEATVRFGALVASLKQASLTFLTVVDSEEERPSAEKMLLNARELCRQPAAEIQVRQGTPAAEILNVSQAGSYDLIIVGAHVVQGFLNYFMRSVTDAVAKHTSRSVLVVKSDSRKLKRLLICTGGQEVSVSVVKWGTQLAQAAKATVGLLHVTDPVPTMYTGLSTMDETLTALLNSNTPLADHMNWCAQYLEQSGIKAKLKLRQGIVSEEIVAEAAENAYDLIVVGARTESNFWNDLLLGKVVPQILHSAPCSVLVIRS